MELNKLIDHTYLKAFGGKEVIEKLCKEAREYHFKSVCVNPANIPLAKELLKGSDVLVCTVIGFPLGQNTTETKVFETRDALAKGADECDMVINVSRLKDKDYNYVKNEIALLKKECGDKTLKVIIETCYLTKEEIKKVSELALEANADFVKTSTGFGTGGALVEDVEIMKGVVGNKAYVKASGGVRTYEDAIKMVNAGASRIGTSNGIDIVKGENK
ncbi:MAG: deoxyribose-phosphate aldolase [Gammaproteobacteria bacterium]|nr:deoxyribose-phosphate aldolase [Gammaproteobacteria bacterium]